MSSCEMKAASVDSLREDGIERKKKDMIAVQIGAKGRFFPR